MQQIDESIPSMDDHFSEFADQFEKNLTLDDQEPPVEVEVEDEDEDGDEVEDDDDDDEDEDEDEDEFEFFVGGGDQNSPVSAEEIFKNGQIRPIFPLFGEQNPNSEEATTSYGPPVKKLFVVSSSAEAAESSGGGGGGVAEGPYCVWSSSDKKSPAETPAPAPEMSRKSNSTGFSKLWKVRDLLVRSHSDGKDAFVFLKGEEKSETASFAERIRNKKMKMKKKANVANIEVGSSETTPSASEKKKKKAKPKSAYEALYGGKKEKKNGKSYLPYRQDLVGFFTNSSGLSRNVHPY